MSVLQKENKGSGVDEVGSYEVFENVNIDNAKIIITQMRDRLSEDLHSWKSRSGIYLLIKNQIDALDIELKEMESD